MWGFFKTLSAVFLYFFGLKGVFHITMLEVINGLFPLFIYLEKYSQCASVSVAPPKIGSGCWEFIPAFWLGMSHNGCTGIVPCFGRKHTVGYDKFGRLNSFSLKNTR